MPQAFTLGRTSKYVQIALTDRYAPRCEPMRTTEVKGKKRYGEGLLYRVVGRVAVGVGQWTDPPDVDKIRAIEGIEPDEIAPHLINDDQFEQLRARLTDINMRKMAEGWTPPIWHWRRYQEFLLPWLDKLGVVHTEAYGDVHFKFPDWWPERLRPTPVVDGWRPLMVIEDDLADMPTVQEDHLDDVG